MSRYWGVKEKLQTTAQSSTISFSAPTVDRSTWAQICACIRERLEPARLSNLPHFPAGWIAEIDQVRRDPISLLPVILVRTFGSLHIHTLSHTHIHSPNSTQQSDDMFKLVKSNLRLHFMQTDSCWWLELHHTVSDHANKHTHTHADKCTNLLFDNRLSWQTQCPQSSPPFRLSSLF